MDEEEQGLLTGAASGAATGAMVGGPAGAVVGGVIGGFLGFSGASAQAAAQKRAQQKAEQARRDAIIKQFGVKQQADSMALAGLSAKSKNMGGVSSTSGGANSPTTQGLIGQNISPSKTSSGTF